MAQLAIQVRDLGKRYRLGEAAAIDHTLRDAVGQALGRVLRGSPFSREAQRSAAAEDKETRRQGEGETRLAATRFPGGEAPPEGQSPNRQIAKSPKRATQDAPQDFWALREVSFDVGIGEAVGVIGRNGAGKSTLLKILSRITDPTTGEAALRGRVASLLEVGTGFHPELTGRENVFLNGAILGMGRREVKAKFADIAEFSGVEKFLDTPVKRYSSGMRVRLAFAVAANLDPEILIVDEVLAVGDAEFQKRCLGKMRDVAGQGRTVLFVSHNMSAVQTLTHRCLWLDAGQVRRLGPSDEVVAAYLDAMDVSAVAETRDLARKDPHHGQMVRICRIEPIVDSPAGFAFGEPLRFDVTLEVQEDIHDLALGTTLHDAGGAPVLTTFSPATITARAGDTLTHRLILNDHRLAPGAYSLSMSILRGGKGAARRLYDLILTGPGFAVSTVPGAGVDPLVGWMREYGPIVHDDTGIQAAGERRREAA